MSDYRAPVEDILFNLYAIAGMDHLAQLPAFTDANRELVEMIVPEAGRFAAEVLSPLNEVGDRQGSRVDQGAVRQADGFAEAYQQLVAAGWTALAGSPEHGGQGLPGLLATAVSETVMAANLAFSLCPMLSQGAVKALLHHGSPALQQTYLPKLVSGEWTGTMNLTEPQAGSDLAAVRTRAIPAGDHYLVTGTKIFITWGDHDMAENIVHLVLARTPDAPEGTRGISLFLVPKYLPGDDGTPGARNDVYPASVEHKLGIHGSPTCVMNFGDNGGAVGYLVGEENQGLACMFTMMNHARIDVGVQGLAISERAYQQAVAYARTRVQGNVKGKRVSIIHHADVRRMLMQMRALVEAMRGVAYIASAAGDLAHHHPDPELARQAQARQDLLTPITKGWLTELANEITSLGIQVHGGMGYVEETGAARHYRDARILAIYEGTNGIQALDLVGRKLTRDGGTMMASLIADIEQTRAELAAGQDLRVTARALGDGLDLLKSARDWLLVHKDQPSTVEASAFDFLMLAGYVVGAWVMARAAIAARAAVHGSDEPGQFYLNKLVTARYYAEHILPRAAAHWQSMQAGDDTVMALAEDQF